MCRGIIRHEAAHRNRSSVSDALIESASLEPDPLNVVMFKTDSPQSSSPQRTPANFQPPSVINPHPDRARSASYRAAVDRSISLQSQEAHDDDKGSSGVEEGEECHDVTPTPESVNKFSLAITSPTSEDMITSPVSDSHCSPDLSLTQSSLSRAQEWVNRSPVPQQRRFVKSKSLINATAPSSSLVSSSPPQEDNGTGEGKDRPLSSSLTTAALRSMRAEQPRQYSETTLSSACGGRTESPSAHIYMRLHSAPLPTSSVSQQLKSSSLGSAGSIRSLGSTPPDGHTSPSASGNSPLSQRKSPKLQGLILKVDPSGGSSLAKSSPPVGTLVSSGQQSSSASSLPKPPQSTSAPALPRVVISTQHPTLGMFTDQAEHTQSLPMQQNLDTSAADVKTQLASSSSSSALEMPTSTPVFPKPSTAPRHPTSLITQQLNKMMQAVAEASASAASSSPFKVSSYNSKTAPATLMGNAYRLPSSTASTKAHPQVSPTCNPPTPLSPTSSERGPAVTPGGRSDSLSTVGSSSIHSRSVHLRPPSDSSDTESIASTGPMLDDDQVRLSGFSHLQINLVFLKIFAIWSVISKSLSSLLFFSFCKEL